jgi:hypothetical protein
MTHVVRNIDPLEEPYALWAGLLRLFAIHLSRQSVSQEIGNLPIHFGWLAAT